MANIGTPTTSSATKILLLGSGELGREVAIESMRLGAEVIAVDRYENAPAMQVAHKSYVASMLEGAALRDIIRWEKPDLIVPEIEAIATTTLIELEEEGFRVIPTARAVSLTMHREGIRRLAAEELGLPTSSYRFATNQKELRAAVEEIGFPCIVKPVMSSSGKGQSLLKSKKDVKQAWEHSQNDSRGERGKVIVEGFIDFDYEITLLTVMHENGISFCEPIGHYQEDGDYRMSWQPQPMSEKALENAKDIASKVVQALCSPSKPGLQPGRGIFGVELFIKEDKVWFSEVSPRPHDTGLVTCISQNLSEFALHARAILGLPIPAIRQNGPAASSVILPTGESNRVTYYNLDKALQAPDTNLMLFGKPEIHGTRRMGVALALGQDIEDAKNKAKETSDTIKFSF